MNKEKLYAMVDGLADVVSAMDINIAIQNEYRYLYNSERRKLKQTWNLIGDYNLIEVAIRFSDEEAIRAWILWCLVMSDTLDEIKYSIKKCMESL